MHRFKVMLEDMVKRGVSQRPISLYRGAGRKADLYLLELPEKWARQYPNLRFITALSEEMVAHAAPDWSSAR